MNPGLQPDQFWMVGVVAILLITANFNDIVALVRNHHRINAP